MYLHTYHALPSLLPTLSMWWTVSLPLVGFSMAEHTFELTGPEYILEVSGLEWNPRMEWNGDCSFRTAA